MYFHKIEKDHHRKKTVRITNSEFEKVYSNPNFLSGVQRIERGLANDYKICFMCSEKYPINCHRFWMVGYYFAIKNKNKHKIINIIDNETDVEFDSSNFHEIEELLKNKKIYKGDFDYKDAKEIIKVIRIILLQLTSSVCHKIHQSGIYGGIILIKCLMA